MSKNASDQDTSNSNVDFRISVAPTSHNSLLLQDVHDLVKRARSEQRELVRCHQSRDR